MKKGQSCPELAKLIDEQYLLTTAILGDVNVDDNTLFTLNTLLRGVDDLLDRQALNIKLNRLY